MSDFLTHWGAVALALAVVLMMVDAPGWTFLAVAVGVVLWVTFGPVGPVAF